MSWPLSQDYNEAIQSPQEQLRRPRPAARRGRLQRPGPADALLRQLRRRLPGALPRRQELGRQVLHARGRRPARTLPGNRHAPPPGEAALHGGLHLPGTGHPRGRAMVSRAQDAMGRGADAQPVRRRSTLDKPAMLEALSQMWGRMAQAPARRRGGPLRLAARQRPAGAGRRLPLADAEADRLRRHVGAGPGGNEVGRGRPPVVPAPAAAARRRRTTSTWTASRCC